MGEEAELDELGNRVWKCDYDSLSQIEMMA